MDPVSIALNVVKSISDRANQAKTNKEDCQQLAALAQRTVQVLQQVEGRVDSDGALSTSLEVLNNALEASDAAVKECCEVSAFVALLQAGKYNDQLKQAATSLAHALDQLPLATVGLTTDIHDCVLTLKEELNKARFHQTAQEATRTRKLKEEMEIMFKDNRRSNEDLKTMIKSMVVETSQTAEQQNQDIRVLKKYLVQANQNKERQEAYEIEQIISAMETSKEEMAKSSAASTLEQIESLITCPISKEPMADPVLLRDSCMTYDRSSIVEWLRLCNRRDPMTNAEIVSGDLFPNRAIRNVVDVLLGTETEKQTSKQETPKIQTQLVPGLYEGYGTYQSDAATIPHQFTVLILEPGGNIVGCTLTRDSAVQPFERIIFRGKWQADSAEMQWTDEYYINQCTVTVDPQSHSGKFSLEGTSTPHVKSLHRYTIHYETFRFACPHMTVCPLMYHCVPPPGLLEMDGVLQRGEQRFKQKLVILIHGDSTFNGWLHSVNLSSNTVNYGRISSGNMQNLDDISFSVQFVNLKEESEESTDAEEVFRYTGQIGQRGGAASLQTSELAGFSRYVTPSAGKSTADLPLPKMAEFTFNSIRQTSRDIPERLACHIKPMRHPSEPERDIKSGTFKIWTAEEITLEGKTQHRCMEVSRHNWMEPYVDNMVQCNWHHSHSIYPLWTAEKTHGVGNYYIKTHETYWSGGRDRWVPDSCYLTVENNSNFVRERSEGYYLVVHPDKDRACVWNVTYDSAGIKLKVARPPIESEHEEVTGCFFAKPRVLEKRGGEYVYFAMLTYDSNDALAVAFDYQGVNG